MARSSELRDILRQWLCLADPGCSKKRDFASYLRFAAPFSRLFSPEVICTTMQCRYNVVDTSLRTEKNVDDVASVLYTCKVSRVALSACSSSYAGPGMVSNMTQALMQKQILFVSAMLLKVKAVTVQIYYHAFYEAFLLRGKSFYEAAAIGRQAVRSGCDLGPHHSLLPNVFAAATFQPQVIIFPSNLRIDPLLLGSSIQGSSLMMLGCLGCRFLSWWIMLPSLVASCTFLIFVFLRNSCWGPSNRYESLERGIKAEHAIIEDLLTDKANQQSLYVHSTKINNLNKSLRCLVELWLDTGFIDSFCCVDAQWLEYGLWNFPACLFCRSRTFSNPKSRGRDENRKRLVVIEGIQKLFRGTEINVDELTSTERASLRRVTAFIRRSMRQGKSTYIIITGQYEPNWWMRAEWSDAEMRDTWGKAVAHSYDSFLRGDFIRVRDTYLKCRD